MPAEPERPAPCRTCQEFALAEAVADGERDYSRATDCRVLLKRHRETAECTAAREEA
ncbi:MULTISPECIES: hypothetical protein [Streptomyces]|uniref:hypothetical protein n=1 Tax=Streptomyces TaxID=1883 RepID=UPI0002DE1A78|nr:MULTISPECIES: hypothetical protein [Streptomyces]UYM25019.1 hypothetical protein NQP46_22545 [Streptomyces albus]WDV31527.1 hypothetical protein OIM90_09760 [Streptomyces sp. AD16]ESQ00039.1 Hypothetical protein B591_09975 [Streptomyces sp. GBA 94-10 4N24]ESQ06091.1 Hypothetical protein B590_10105 [Streptomyces sp. PVA_94-07]RPK60779.1 hypothetical protein EES44_20055 [Streptomyces sp. ADI96-15]